jgi:hypothetical protein
MELRVRISLNQSGQYKANRSLVRPGIAAASLVALLVCGVATANDRNGNACNGQVVQCTSKIAGGFTHPYKMIFDNGDIILTSDGAISRISPSGKVTKIADTPNGPPGSASKYAGDYIFVDNPLGRLLRVTPEGKETVIATGLGMPNVAVQDGDDFVVVDIGTPTDDKPGPARLLRVSPEGNVTTIASKNLGGPAGLYIDEDGYWVPDFILGRLLLVSRTGGVKVIAENLGQPLDIDFDGEAFIISDFADGFRDGVGKGRILRVTKSGDVKVIANRGQAGNPTGLVLRGPDIYYTDVLTGEVLKIKGPRFQTKPVQSGPTN